MSLPYLHTTSPRNENVTVFVSSSSFCIVPALFQKVENLKWQQKRGFRHLNANADAFEIVLQYLMFQKLPETSKLTTKQATEVFKLTKPLENSNVGGLSEHVSLFLEAKQNQKGKKKPSFLKRMSSLKIKRDSSVSEMETSELTTSNGRNNGGSGGSSSTVSGIEEPKAVYNSSVEIRKTRPMSAVDILAEVPSSFMTTINNFNMERSGRALLEHKDSGLTEEGDEDGDANSNAAKKESVMDTYPRVCIPPTSTAHSSSNPFGFHAATTANSNSATTGGETRHLEIRVDVPTEAPESENLDPKMNIQAFRSSSKKFLRKAVRKIQDKQTERAHKNLLSSEYVL